MRKTILYIALGLCIGLCSCGNDKVSSNAPSKSAAALKEQPNNETQENDPQNNEDEENNPQDDEAKGYVHQEDGYFSLVDESYITSVKAQKSGTCWVTAAAVSMESSFALMNGKSIEFDPLDVLDCVLGPNKEEGYFIKKYVDKYNLGGWTFQIIETLSNGYGDYLLVEAEDYKNASREKIQENIKNKGAMVVGINDTKGMLQGTFDGYRTFNAPDIYEFDHAVTIVGWDDNFPKDYFVEPASQNGAWLAQNTRGASWGKGGYYWVSYDTPFEDNNILVMSDEYSDVVSYDGGCENKIKTGASTTIANVFSKEGSVRAVGTYTVAENQKIDIKIYDSEFKELLYEQEAMFEIPGYHTVCLDMPVEVSDYAVAITFDGEAPVEGESWEDRCISYSVKINEHESFVLMDGEWRDLSDQSTIDALGIDFTPNNCCIKSIY